MFGDIQTVTIVERVENNHCWITSQIFDVGSYGDMFSAIIEMRYIETVKIVCINKSKTWYIKSVDVLGPDVMMNKEDKECYDVLINLINKNGIKTEKMRQILTNHPDTINVTLTDKKGISLPLVTWLTEQLKFTKKQNKMMRNAILALV